MHHQPADPRRFNKAVVGVAQVEQQVAVEHRLALLGQAQHGVQLRARLVWHDLPQVLDAGRRHLHVGHEIRPRQREQDADAPWLEDDRVDHQVTRFAMQDRQGPGPVLVAVDHAADQIGALVAVERRVEHLNLAVGLHRRPLTADVFPCHLHNAFDVAVEVLERQGPADIAQQLAHAGPHTTLAAGVVAAVGRWIGLDEFGRDGRSDKDEIVAEVVVVQDFGGDRVEEGLGQFGLPVVDQLADEQQFGALPDRVVQGGRSKIAVEAVDALAHAVLVIANSLADRVLHLVPARLLEALFGACARRSKQGVVAVEAFDQRLRNSFGNGLVRLQWRIRCVGRHAVIMSEA